MVWRRVLLPVSLTLRELHGVIQVATGWEGSHLYQFRLRAARYGWWQLAAASPDVTRAALRFRKGARLVYAYDLNIPWRHEIRIEERLEPEAGKAYPACSGGSGACPPEACGGPTDFMRHRDDMLSLEALEDLSIMAEIIGEVALEGRPEVLDDEETRWRLEQAVEHSQARAHSRAALFTTHGERAPSLWRAPRPHAPAVLTRSARRCARRSAASSAASSPCRCRIPETSA